MGYLGKLILGIFAYLLKGICDICLFTSRDMGYWGPYTSLMTHGLTVNMIFFLHCHGASSAGT